MTGDKVTIGDVTMTNVHEPSKCGGQHCIVHNPLHTRMDDWPLHYRFDRGIFERICPHGVGHPDPSQFDFWHSIGQDYQAVHGCHPDGDNMFCCWT